MYIVYKQKFLLWNICFALLIGYSKQLIEERKKQNGTNGENFFCIKAMLLNVVFFMI